MPIKNLHPRARFFLAVEGQSEEAFVRWLQVLSDIKGLHIHLHTFLLGGGGFKSMRQKAVRLHKLHSRKGGYQDRFLIVDSDRAEQGDWSIGELRCEAAKHKITVCVQCPNHEGLLLRMMPGMEREIAAAASAEINCEPGGQVIGSRCPRKSWCGSFRLMISCEWQIWTLIYKPF